MSNFNALEQSQRHAEYCPLDTTLEILSGKWKSIIVCRLMKNEFRFGELLKEIPNCTKRMLAIQLAQLEDDHIVTKNVREIEHHVRITYTLSKIGLSLIPIIMAMDAWGEQYVEEFKEQESV